MMRGPLQTGMCQPCPILSSSRTAEAKRSATQSGDAPGPGARSLRAADLTRERAQMQDMLLGMAKDNQAAAIQMLITEQGLSANYGNQIGQTPLHVAAIWNSTDAAKVLIDHGANINAQNDMNAATPLHMGAMRGRREFCALLLEVGADPTLQLADGRIAAEMVESDKTLAVSLLEAAERWDGAKEQTAATEAKEA